MHRKRRARLYIAVQTKRGKATQARTNVELREAVADPTYQPHAEISHGELVPPETSEGHEDADSHDVEATSHRSSQVHALIRDDVSDGHYWNILRICEANLEEANCHKRRQASVQ